MFEHQDAKTKISDVTLNGTATISPKQLRAGKHERGQSLVEFALSAAVLLLVFSGTVDLGRAFFTRIMLDSIVSEGTHWIVAYPGCLKYGVAQNSTVSSNVLINCAGTNS